MINVFWGLLRYPNPCHPSTTCRPQFPTKAPSPVPVFQSQQLAGLATSTYVGTAVSANSSVYLVDDFGGRRLLRSLNSGATFNAVSGVPSYEWRGLATSYDAEIMYVAALGQMYKKGAVGGWVDLVNGNSTLALDWRSMSTSPDGMVVMGAAYIQGLWRSSDGGSTWANMLNATMSARAWTGVAMSADGSKVVASAEGPGVFRSADFGTYIHRQYGGPHQLCGTWPTDNAISTPFYTLSLTHTFTHTHTHIQGATWLEITAGTALASTSFSAIACSADGTQIYTCTYNGYVYASFNSGSSFTNILNVYRGYAGIGCNPEGTVVLVAVYGGGFVYRLTY